ncbi:FirrV-1-A50 [Feldmannia irregularis virus a]|uniref:FirrV-1-A50 n=1 Tax=Feldmannia irregularis virus a TaxID=231992 RepID=Q6XM37_9PHYC|nr:FirrV-1-A50 [Feldmannia irregularis virus a]AAR26874.1 FirrV-1-A50 [Feldmannia irregularis virus a]
MNTSMLDEGIVDTVADFVSGYFFYASVCSTWYRVWKRHSKRKVDDVREIFQSVSRVVECRDVLRHKSFQSMQCLAATPHHPDLRRMGNALVHIVEDRPDYVNICTAARCGNIRFVVWAHAFTPPREWDTAICVLACEGVCRPLHMILRLGYQPPPRASVSAAYHKHRGILGLLRRYGGSMRYVTQAFADNQDHEGLAWALRHGIHLDRETRRLCRSRWTLL